LSRYTTTSSFTAAAEQLAEVTQLRTLTGESMSAIIRRALKELVSRELPHRLAEAARKGQQ
jgi:hypothetical protein